jgi:hypothetical protein
LCEAADKRCRQRGLQVLRAEIELGSRGRIHPSDCAPGLIPDKGCARREEQILERIMTAGGC